MGIVGQMSIQDKQKLAVISGATGGIGSVVAKHLWYVGYSLIALGRTPSKVDALRDWFIDHPRNTQEFLCLCFDLTHPEEYWRLTSMLMPRIKQLSLLAVCHGADPVPTEALAAEEALRYVHEVDMMGAYRLCASVGRYMIQRRGGAIVLLSSIHAQATYPCRVPYAVAKSGISGLVRSLAVEWGEHNITVNAICPWQTSGERTNLIAQHEWEDEGSDTLRAYKERSPLRRLVAPEDIARTVQWLAETSSVSGTEVLVDCGVRASAWHRPFLEESS